VREQSERDAGHIPGSLFEPWHDIHELPDDLDPARPVAVLCASGQRAAVAASLLQRYGAKHVIHVVSGGVPRWEELGQPIVKPEKTPV
jgi:rhodanese-related sulfurtransferase